MTTIVLARHGKPVWSDSTLISGHGLSEWVKGRDGAPIDPTHTPSPELKRIARAATGLAASPLRRSLESVNLLAPEAIPYVDPVFREAEVPGEIPLGIPLPAQFWSKMARVAWYGHLLPAKETYEEAKRRASRAAELLVSIVPENGLLLLVGHGILNGMIGARLRETGWNGPLFRPRRIWAFGVYTRKASP